MKAYLALALALFLAGCASAQFAPSRIDVAYPPRTQPEKIEMYRSASPSKPFMEIGAATACCSNNLNSMIALLQQKAAESGGDALTSLDVRADGRVSATVVRYK